MKQKIDKAAGRQQFIFRNDFLKTNDKKTQCAGLPG
jgi:hypothetical protein